MAIKMVGYAIAAGSLFVMIGALLFRRVARFGVPLLLTLSFALAGAGFVQLAAATSYNGILIGVAINNLGTGLLLPTLLTWVMRQLPFAQRGRGAGFWTACFFCGQFGCPLVVMAISKGTGGLAQSMGVLGWCCMAMATTALLTVRRRALKLPA